MHDHTLARAFALASLLTAPAALAVTAADIAQGYAEEAKRAAPQFGGSSPARGKAEKWFRRNCNDVLDRACTAQEKGNILAYLMQLSRGGRP